MEGRSFSLERGLLEAVEEEQLARARNWEAAVEAGRRRHTGWEPLGAGLGAEVAPASLFGWLSPRRGRREDRDEERG